jgi:predicted nucleic acid-binding protein
MIVADTSVLIKLIVPEPRSDLARALRTQQFAAPILWIAETANVLWRKAISGEMSKAEALWRHDILASGGIRNLPLEPLAQSALSMSIELKHPVYDCFFLEAAIREGTHVVTDDKRFAHAVRSDKRWDAHLRLLTETQST